MLEMGQHCEEDLGQTTGNKVPMRETCGREKCNQCNYTFTQPSALRTNLNKCNKCEYASVEAGDLKTHLKIHSEEKNKQM